MSGTSQSRAAREPEADGAARAAERRPSEPGRALAAGQEPQAQGQAEGARATSVARAIQRTFGNSLIARAAAQAGQPPVVQARLVVTDEGDPFEREADAAARRATSDAETSVGAGPAPGSVRHAAASAFVGAPITPEVEAGIAARRGAGQPLGAALRARMEAAMGADFGAVRVHSGPAAHALNQTLEARAFTAGRDIFFRQGEFQPDSGGGQELLAHELAHVVQQGAADGAPAAVQRTTPKTHLFGKKADRRLIPSTATLSTAQSLSAFGTIETVMFTSTNRVMLRGRFYHPASPRFGVRAGDRKVVLFLSGSGGSAEKYSLMVADHYCSLGASVLAVNYRGFGESSQGSKPVGHGGKPSEQGLYDDALAMYNFLNTTRQYPDGSIVIHGYSLGGAVAAGLAKKLAKGGHRFGGLVLVFGAKRSA